MRKLLVTFVTKHLFRWVSEEDIFRLTSEGILHRGKLLTKEEVTTLSEQAGRLRSTYLWRVLSSEIRYAAYLHWVKTGEDLSGRMLLRADEIINKTINSLAALQKGEE